MNKLGKILLALLGGMDVVVYIFTPIFLVAIWMTISEIDWRTYIFFAAGLFSSLFRSIKVGFMK